MGQNFEYRIEKENITITKYIGTDTIVDVPETIDGIEVNKIGKYAFSECRDLLEVNLPNSINIIGSHAFYNCRKLMTISASDGIYEMEDGAFKNCEELRNVTLYMVEGRAKCIKDLLAESNQEMYFTLIYDEKQEESNCSKLVFPSYIHDYVEHTEARIINQVTYGAGVHYRECMNNNDVDYKRYDELFRYVTVNAAKETAYNIAINRLCYPYKLLKDAKAQYYEYLFQELSSVITKCLKQDDMKRLEQLADLGLFTESNIEDMIELAHSSNHIEATSFFMQYKKINFTNIEKTFEL